MTKSVTRPELSVVVPLYNEEDSVALLYSAIVDSLQNFEGEYEILLVDDGSTDNTRREILKLAVVDRRLKYIGFRRNFGQTPAMAAGIDLARGSVIVTMDGDLQNDPRDIVKLVNHIHSGFDLAVGWRYQRQDKLLTRKVPSVIANWLIGKVTGVPIKDNGCSLKAYRADLIKQVPLYSEMHRFIPAMSSLTDARIVEVKVRHHARQHGTSKYGLSRIYKVLFDLLAIKTLTGFSARPLSWFGLLSFPFAFVAIICLAWALWLSISGAQSVFVIAGLAVTFGGGASFIVICGVLAELIYKTGDVRPSDFLLGHVSVGRAAGSSTTQETECDHE